MKTNVFFFALVTCCLSLSCAREEPLPDGIESTAGFVMPAPPQALPSIAADNRFGLRIYESIYRASPDSNLCVSPFSIRTALSLVANGANGESLAEIVRAFGLSGTELAAMNESYQDLTARLAATDRKVTYESANSFWYQEGMTIRPGFLTNMGYYRADVFPVNFRDHSTLGLINGWVCQKTHGKIEKIVDAIPPGTLMNLTNAIYFNGEWTWKFNPDNTKWWSFKKLDRTHVDMSAMGNTKAYRFYEHPSWYGLEMPYGNGSWAMYVFMPKTPGLLDQLTPWVAANWEAIRTKFESDKPIEIRFPRFKIENSYDLKPLLQQLGINRVFNPGADFSNMTDSPLWIGKAIHKTYIRVNEDGTEAAGVTSFFGIMGSPPGLFFDHPFLYVIAERSTGLILFIGQVTDPSS